MVLFVDDDIARHLIFARRYPGAYQTSSLVVAQHELNQTPSYISQLWLDHDLGHGLARGAGFDAMTGQPSDTEELTIRPLVRWLCESPVVPRSLPVVIHSWNGPAAATMKASLEAAGFTNVTQQPFSFGDDR